MSIFLGTWNINGNGFLGQLNFFDDPSGQVQTGNIYDQPLENVVESGNVISFTRNLDNLSPGYRQAYTGTVYDSSFGRVLIGLFIERGGTGPQGATYGWSAVLQ